MITIKKYVVIFFLLASFPLFHSNAMDNAAKEEDFEEALKKIENILAPWDQRTKEAEDYMNKAVKLGAIQIVEEQFKGSAVITTFNPDTKMVDLQVGLLHESIEFNFFMRWLDTSNTQGKNIKKTSSKMNIFKCVLQ